jgi:hypothetical protein
MGLLILLGLLAPLWWTWAASQLAFRIYVAVGSPSHPSPALLWGSVYAPALVLGFVAGLVTTLLAPALPLKGWLIFCGSLLLGAAVVGLLTGATAWASLASLFASYGNLLFWGGSIVWPLLSHVRARDV